MASISSLGIGAGFDLSTVLTNLTTAEKAALAPISAQQSAYTAKLTAYGTLKSALTAFQTANTALSNANIFQSTTATSSAPSAFTAATAAGAAAGQYTVEVTQLAQAQSLLSGKVTSTTDSIGSTATTRTLTISQPGKEKPLEIQLTDKQTSLTGVRDAINNAAAGINASIIKVDDDHYQLVVTSGSTGKNNAMTIAVKGDDTLQRVIGYDKDAAQGTNGMTESIPAKNALLKVNNVAIERDSNTIIDAPEGVTLTLLNKTDGVQSLTIGKDIAKTTSVITDWVKAYNALQTTFDNLTSYTGVDAGQDQNNKNGALLGDSTLRTIQTQLQSQLTNAASSSTFKTLAQIGITQDPNSGQLNVDNDKLKASVTSDAKGVMAMIVGDGKTTGIATTIGRSLASYTSTTGILAAATDGVNSTLKKLTEQFNTANDRINSNIQRYKTQFTQLDVLMTRLNNTSSYLTSQFSTSNDSK
ncbi:flagellar capping protein [[Pantoea] beijingensis]|uniref:Flagellar hook-associated protein 2 n=1 Tax=[Pantoea] beijingensis TaxID=1324864 RepID=A0A443IIP5_9GAMM|nr:MULTISPECIES: flagellar filament capping protein FliD [Erwiniaceae]RWR03899.1 flagellar capping protein [[Pantoea] beijingensis]